MNDNHGHLDKGDHLRKIMTECPELEKVVELPVVAGPVSPLGWSIRGRLICGAVASALLWLSVAWAIGWLP